MIAFDKTGTLTKGEFSIDKIILENEYSEDDIIYYASLAEQHSLHPLAKPILERNNRQLASVEEYKEVAGQGIHYSYKNHHYFVGKKNRGYKEIGSIVEVFEDDKLIGTIVLVDTIRANIYNLVQQLDELKIKSMILSGDNSESVRVVADKLKIKDVYSNLLPEDKYNIINTMKSTIKGNIAYVGDGLNDAPSLMLADVGITMGINGVDASIEAGDIVLVDDDPNKIVKAINISKYTQKIVWQNIIFSAAIKFSFLLLASFGVTGMFSAVFADVGVTLLAIINSMRALVYRGNK
jgi:Cd2+/Zn2+-exporting ATPase